MKQLGIQSNQSLTVRVFALFQSLTEAFTQRQVSLAGGAVQELSHLKMAGARLGRSRTRRLLEEDREQTFRRENFIFCFSYFLFLYCCTLHCLSNVQKAGRGQNECFV